MFVFSSPTLITSTHKLPKFLKPIIERIRSPPRERWIRSHPSSPSSMHYPIRSSSFLVFNKSIHEAYSFFQASRFSPKPRRCRRRFFLESIVISVPYSPRGYLNVWVFLLLLRQKVLYGNPVSRASELAGLHRRSRRDKNEENNPGFKGSIARIIAKPTIQR